MASKNSNKISIKPMNNAAALASTLGISAENLPTEAETIEQPSKDTVDSTFTMGNDGLLSNFEVIAAVVENKAQKAAKRVFKPEKKRELVETDSSNVASSSSRTENPSIVNLSTALEMPLLVDIKRKFPGKELYILCLLYLQRNNRGLVQMTVSNMMALYSSVFQDVIKDDTARRSLKRLHDAGFIRTISIPGNNSGYIYEISDLLETDVLNKTEKEEFFELSEFVRGKLNNFTNA